MQNRESISLWGDFRTDSIQGLELEESLKNLLRDCVINVVNFEAPVTSGGKPICKSGPNHQQSVEGPFWLEQQGFNAISLANNHIMDFGEEGLLKTIQLFERSTVMGAGRWHESFKVNTFKISNWKVGIICASQCEFGALYDYPSQKSQLGYAWISHHKIKELIISSKEQLDILLIYVHAGLENFDYPLPEWRELYRSFIDLGVDAVIASHPHVPQGWEVYKEKLICYSLGNFCFQKKKLDKKRLFWNNGLVCKLSILDKHQLDYELFPIKYIPHRSLIEFDTSHEIESHLKGVSSVLEDEGSYLSIINQKTLELLPHYMGLFSRSGLISSVFSKDFYKGLVEWFNNSGHHNRSHALNNLRCESHRWVIERAIINKYKI